MSQDMNINALRTNCFRQSKVKGEYMLQMRVPGGLIQAKYLSFVEHLAEAYGDGTFHFGSRQCFAIPGIKYENIDAVNKELKDYLEDVEIAQCGVKMETDAGFPTRISAWSWLVPGLSTVSRRISIHRIWQKRLNRRYSRVIIISRLRLPAVRMTAPRDTSMILESSV